MDFKFTEEQLMIRDTAEAFLSDVSTSTAIRQAMETQLGYDPELWQRICNDMYWQALLIPEEYGGMGLGYVELPWWNRWVDICCAPHFFRLSAWPFPLS